MKRKYPLFLLALGAAITIPTGVAHANSFTADANCDGLTFTMPRGEAGTVVEATVDGRRVAIGTVANFADPIAFTVPNPDPTVAHRWVVTVDSVYNADQSWSETVPACSQPVATTTTTPPVASTTTTTVVAVTTPPVPPSSTTTVPVPGRPIVTTTTTTTPAGGPYRLPDTGNSTVLAVMAFVAGCFVVAGLLAKNWGDK